MMNDDGIFRIRFNLIDRTPLNGETTMFIENKNKIHNWLRWNEIRDTVLIPFFTHSAYFCDNFGRGISKKRKLLHFVNEPGWNDRKMTETEPNTK